MVGWMGGCPNIVGEDGAGTWIGQIIVCGCVLVVSMSTWVWVVEGPEGGSWDGAGAAHTSESMDLCERFGIGAGTAQRDDVVEVVVAGSLSDFSDDSR